MAEIYRLASRCLQQAPSRFESEHSRYGTRRLEQGIEKDLVARKSESDWYLQAYNVLDAKTVIRSERKFRRISNLGAGKMLDGLFMLLTLSVVMALA